MREWFTNEQRDRKYAGNCAKELREDIEDRIPIFYFSKTPKRQCDRRIKMGARPFTERRENKCDGCAAHSNACEHTTCELAGDEIKKWRTRMMKQIGERPVRGHEESELGTL